MLLFSSPEQEIKMAKVTNLINGGSRIQSWVVLASKSTI